MKIFRSGNRRFKNLIPVSKPGKWLEILKKIPAIVTFLISICTFYFGIVQYYYSQNLIDRRKYFNEYYDERFQVFKDLARHTSDIHAIIQSRDFLREGAEDSILKKLAIFDYARLVLNKNNYDSLVLNDIEDYLDKINTFINDTANRDHYEIYKSQKKILEDAGIILANEKDSINSFNFKFFPFGKN